MIISKYLYNNMFKQFIKERLETKLKELETKTITAGVLIKCTTTDNIFLVLRNSQPPVWALVSGGIDTNENIINGLKREIQEELFVKPNNIEFKFIRVEQIPEKNREFHYYEGFVDKQFKPILDHENLNFGWFSKNHLPSPLYKGLLEKIKNI